MKFLCQQKIWQNQKQEQYLQTKKYLKNILSRFMKSILIFLSIIKKYKLTIMIKSTYYLELIFIFLNILQQQKSMKKVILTETLNLKEKDKRHQKKNLTVNLLELILAEKLMMQTMKLVECKHLLAILIKKNQRTRK